MARKVGFVRTLDELGRVVIPKEVLRENGWGGGSLFEMISTTDGVLIKPFRLAYQCYICLSPDDLVQVKDRCLCQRCVDIANQGRPVE